MKKDFILTFLTQIIILVSGLLVFKLAYMQYGEIGFSEFSLVKRNLAYIYTVIFIGLGIAIPRYIALEKGMKNKHENHILLAAFLMILSALIFCLIIFLLFKDEIAYLLFGSPLYAKYIMPILLSISGLTLHGLVYAYYRGKMFFKYSNQIEIINLAILPLLAFIFAPNIITLFSYTGLMISITSSIVLIKILSSSPINIKLSKTYLPKLFTYGIQRLPADFGMASLLTIPAILSAHNDGVLMAGYISFSISLLSLSGQVVAPIGLIMLPKISQLLGEGNLKMITYYVQKLFLLSIVTAILGTVIFQIFAQDILALYLGTTDSTLIRVSKDIMWGALFYPIYVTMRSVVDAYYIRAYNTVSIFISLIIFLFTYFITLNIPSSLTTSLCTLTIMTLYFSKPLLFKDNT